jgi:glutamate/tyrosine decarboxylase-like PLP-dependent enzyme
MGVVKSTGILSAAAFPRTCDGVNPHSTAMLQSALSLILDAFASASDRPPMPLTISQDLVKSLAEIPERGEEEESILAKLAAVLASSKNNASPGYLAHMDATPTTASIAGAFATAALKNSMLSVEMSPVFSRLEPLLVRALAQMFGLGSNSGGVIVSGGTLANLQALAVARNVKLRTHQDGLSGLAQMPVLLTSEVAHTSIQKAAMLLGLGIQAVKTIPTNSNSQMDPHKLRTIIEEARAAGQKPFCVVATAGTTITGNIDPLYEMSRICEEYDLWFHVDAIYGGALVFSSEHRQRLAGIEMADSVAFNPHKWLYVANTCSMVLFREYERLQTDFRIGAPYMGEGDTMNLGEINVQGSREPEVLSLALSLHHLGRAGYDTLIERSYLLTRAFVREVLRRPDLELAGSPETNIVVFRVRKGSAEMHAELHGHLLRQDIAFSLVPYKGQQWFRVVFLNTQTDESMIQRVFSFIDGFLQPMER